MKVLSRISSEKQRRLIIYSGEKIASRSLQSSVWIRKKSILIGFITAIRGIEAVSLFLRRFHSAFTVI